MLIKSGLFLVRARMLAVRSLAVAVTKTVGITKTLANA
jgi:hypothetical protein